ADSAIPIPSQAGQAESAAVAQLRTSTRARPAELRRAGRSSESKPTRRSSAHTAATRGTGRPVKRLSVLFPTRSRRDTWRRTSCTPCRPSSSPIAAATSARTSPGIRVLAPPADLPHRHPAKPEADPQGLYDQGAVDGPTCEQIHRHQLLLGPCVEAEMRLGEDEHERHGPVGEYDQGLVQHTTAACIDG